MKAGAPLENQMYAGERHGRPVRAWDFLSLNLELQKETGGPAPKEAAPPVVFMQRVRR
jgi:hypothetical protein